MLVPPCEHLLVELFANQTKQVQDHFLVLEIWLIGLLAQKAEYCLLFNLSYVTDLIAQVCISCHLLLVSIEVILLVLILSLNETTEIP